MIKHKCKNEYLLTDGIWVRNFCIQNVPYIDINTNLIRKDEYTIFLQNEVENMKKRYVDVEVERQISKKKIIIVSDGHGFQEKQAMLKDIPSDVCIIGTNKTLAKWAIDRPMTYFVVNNPYPECLRYVSKKHPKCIASIRTYPKFLEGYRGPIFTYSPVPESYYAGLAFDHAFKIDDYRNPICAAIGLAYRFGVEKLMLFCCDDSFSEERPGSEKLENGLWSYPQQILSQKVVDANLYWLKSKEVTIFEHSSGIKYANASYLSSEKVVEFFSSTEN